MKTTDSTRSSKILLKPLVLALALGAGSAHGQIIEVGGAGVIGDSTLTTTLGVAKLTATGANWRAPGGNGNTFSSLISPSVAVTATGAVTLTFTHRYDFETTFDGGVVFVSVNGGVFTKVPLASFTTNGYNGVSVASVWPAAEEIFTGTSTDYGVPTLITSVADLGILNATDTVAVEFRGGWDGNTNGANPNWEIGAVNIVDTGGTLLDADFTPDGASGFTASFTGTSNSPWQYNPTQTHRFELDANTDTADRYKPDIVGSVINLNGAKIQVALLNGTLASGDVFSLFDLSVGTTLTGSPHSISLPPSSGIWNTSSLATAGTITLTTAFIPADGTWITDGNGNWIDTVNWSGSTLAYGTDKTASFTANITAARTVTLGADITIGNITFTDSTTASHDLTISGANILTLDVTTGKPLINVTQTGNRQLSINSVISGSDGLQKNGPGILNLGGANTYTGSTVLNDGLLNFGSINMDGFGGGAGSRDISVVANKIVQRTASALNAAFMKRLVETSDEFAVCSTASGAADVGTGNTLDFSSSINGANLPNAFFASFATNGGQCRFNGTIIPASDNYRIGFTGTNGALSMIQPLVDVGTPRGLIIGGATPVLVADNTFTGDTALRAGRLFLGRQLALQNSALNVGNGVDGNTGLLCFLASNVGGATQGQLTDQPTLGGLIGSRNLLTIYSNANQNNTTRLAATAVLGLTLDVDTGKTHAYSGNVKLATGMYLTKTGPGTQILSGASDYTGATTISNGTLLVNNTTGSGTGTNSVSVTTGTLGGSGVITGAVTIGNSIGSADAILAPGNSIDSIDTGNLAFNSDGSYACELNGSLVTSDQTNVTGTVTVNVAATLTVSLTGSLASSQKYFIVNNDAGDPVAGTFAGLAQNAVVGNYGGTDLKISYTGDSGTSAISGGNDIVLYTDATATPYDTWAATGPFANPPFSNTLPEVDFDNDGIKNLLEFVLGGDPTISQADIAPTVTTSGSNLVMTFKRSDASELAPAVTVKVELSTDLSFSTPADDITIGPATDPGPIAPSGASYTVSNSGGLDTITLTIPQGAAPKKFARVKAVKP